MHPSIPMKLSEAIAREEGFYVPKSRAARNHNPGNVEYGTFAISFGAKNGDPRFAIFPDDTSGFACLKHLLKSHYRGLTLAVAIAKWAPSTENDTTAYIRAVCAWTELQPDTIIDEYI